MKKYIVTALMLLLSVFVMNIGEIFAVEAEQEKPVSTEASETQVQKIDVNTATLEELEALPGIGPKLAQAIIDARPFASIDDLVRVKGIAEKKLESIKDLVTVTPLAEGKAPTKAVKAPETSGKEEAAKTAEIKKIDLNSATVEELESLPGVGKKTAEAIIAGRPYKTIEDLLNIKGFGEKNLGKIKDLIEVIPVQPKEEAKKAEKTK